MENLPSDGAVQSRGIPGKRGKKGENGERGEKGEVGSVGIKGNKDDPGKSFNESRIHHVEKENKKLKKEVHRLENFSQELQGKYEKLETENTNLKNLVFKFMGGKPCVVDLTAPPNGYLSEPTGSVLPHASDVIITCGSGYFVKGESKYSCDDGTFPLLEQTECVFIAPECNVYKESSNSNGVYPVTPFSDQTTVMRVYCDLNTDEYGWIVIMRRFDGSLSFGRSWEDYSSGFGNIQSEHWMGLRDLYNIVKRQNYVLRVDLERFNGDKSYAQYETFYIGSEDEKFPIYFEDYSGTAGGGLGYSNYIRQGQKFTIDSDNDEYSGINCASGQGRGGWWYRACSHNSLTGRYEKPGSFSAYKGLTWYPVTGSSESLKTVQT